MFFIPRVNVIESDKGFSIEVLGRTGMKYREGSRSMFIDSEVLMPGHGIAIIPGSIKHWDPPHDSEVVDSQKREEIIINIREALAFRNAPLKVI